MAEQTENVFAEFADAAKNVAEKAVNGIKTFGSNVADVSKGAIEGAKLNNARANKQKEIDEAFQKLGEMVYQQGNLTGAAAEQADKIHQLYAELQNIEIARNVPDPDKKAEAHP